MTAHALVRERGAGWHRAVMNRPDRHNSLTPELVDALFEALQDCEEDAAARAFIIEGAGGYFSSGMDLAAAAGGPGARGAGGDAFVRLLKRMTTSSVVVASVVDGTASGGGVGLAAASDFVFATPRSQFSLPELLWGLLPCVVAPFLIRRVGFQACQRMTLLTSPIGAELALRYGLVDAIDEAALPRLLQRLQSVAPEGIGKAKRYLSRLWILDDAMLNVALDELDQLLAAPEVADRLRGFAEHARYPWEKPAERAVASLPARTMATAKRAWLFPGQGTQRRGMGREVLDLYPGLVATADDILGYSIRSLCLDDPDDRLSKTQFCQPALYVVNALTFLERRRREEWPDIMAGHSLGEYSALFAAGAFDFVTGLRIVQRRGELMAQATAGAMLAVIGPRLEELTTLINELGLHDLDVANYNLPTQTVMSGSEVSIDGLAETIVGRELGRAVHMHIGGAFHGRLAAPAARAFDAELHQYDLRDPVVPTISNVTARPYAPGTVREVLGKQMSCPVRWVETMAYLRSQGVTEARQIGPGRVLDGLWERFEPGASDAQGLDHGIERGDSGLPSNTWVSQ